jgi:hypothetical protein
MRFWCDRDEAITGLMKLSPQFNQSALLSVHGLTRFGLEEAGGREYGVGTDLSQKNPFTAFLAYATRPIGRKLNGSGFTARHPKPWDAGAGAPRLFLRISTTFNQVVWLL